MTERREYTDKLKKQIDEWDSSLAELERKAETLSEEKKSEFREQIIEMRARRDKMKADLERLKAATDDAWESIRDEIQDAWVGVKVAVKRAQEQVTR